MYDIPKSGPMTSSTGIDQLDYELYNKSYKVQHIESTINSKSEYKIYVFLTFLSFGILEEI